MLNSNNEDNGYGQVPRAFDHQAENAVYDLSGPVHFDELEDKVAAGTRLRYQTDVALMASRQLVYDLIQIGADDDKVVAMKEIYQHVKNLKATQQ